MDNYNLVKFKYYLLETFKAFKEVCTIHNLTYYAAFGTALGAVRHQGFIPWDDDIEGKFKGIMILHLRMIMVIMSIFLNL